MIWKLNFKDMLFFSIHVYKIYWFMAQQYGTFRVECNLKTQRFVSFSSFVFNSTYFYCYMDSVMTVKLI